MQNSVNDTISVMCLRSSKIHKRNDKVWLDVLKTYCSKETLETYNTLTSIDAKEKMINTLKATVMSHSINTKIQKNLKRSFSSSKTQYIVSVKSSEPIIDKAIKFEDGEFMFDNYSRIKKILIEWGTIRETSNELLRHEQQASSLKSNTANPNIGNYYASDKTVIKTSANITDFWGLRKVFIKDLMLFEDNKGCYIEGKLIVNPLVMVGLSTFLEDDEGNIIKLALYNFVSNVPEKWKVVEKRFTPGIRLIIAEPFLKIFMDGSRGIRVDNPSDIRIIGRDEECFEEIRKTGKELIDSEEYVLALELYLNAMEKISKSIIPLLNYRSQTEMKLEQYEEALLDAAAVLFLTSDNKAEQRYKCALQQLGSSDNSDTIKCLWLKILKGDVFIENLTGYDGSREAGNMAYEAGDYLEAKRQYSSHLVNSDICDLLTDISTVCLKLNIFQTAISASSACIRITTDEQRRQGALYYMAKAFLMVGEPDLYRLCSNYLPHSKEDLEKMLNVVTNCENVFYNLMVRYEYLRLHGKNSQITDFFSSTEFVSDFLQPNSMEHAYVTGKETGIKAKRDIKYGELLLIDHPLTYRGQGAINHINTIATMDCNTSTIDSTGHVLLLTKLLTLVKHDVLLCQKLLCLGRRGIITTDKRVPLLDLEWMGYRSFSYNILPFLPQFVEVHGNEVPNINLSCIDTILDHNTFQWNWPSKDQWLKREGICLRMSLFNHEKDSNCDYIPIGDAMLLYAKRDIPQGNELTIEYT